MDDMDSPSTIARKVADAAALSAVWDQFYAHCSDIINGCPGVRRLSSADREDCVQDVMMELVRKFGEQRPEAGQENLAGWIRTVSRNKAVDIIRKRYRSHEICFDDGSGSALVDREVPEANPEREPGARVSLIWEALVSLDQKVPVTSYLVFYLHSIEGWKILEIAELFQITPDQVRARSHRVKKKIGSYLESKSPRGTKRRDAGTQEEQPADSGD